MGFAIAEELSELGANVTLITGPTALKLTDTGIKRIDVTSAEEMLQAVMQTFPKASIAILSAAVADYRPAEISEIKIKKQDSELNLNLVKTPDILASLGCMKKSGQILAGFALETNDEEENAIAKLRKKNLDFIVLNSLRDEGAGFKNDHNKITIIDKMLSKQSFPLKLKTEVAKDICKKVLDLLS
jgi:phosphopantothenoylcysteine decarboxylase/phosphopantothenate--cysteine ligase